MKFLLTTILVFISIFLQAQFDLKGVVTNASNEPLIGATVVILERADSTMYAFALTNDDGKYTLEDV